MNARGELAELAAQEVDLMLLLLNELQRPGGA